jgi:pimeloyl-ACP methyl ester carboxylesterase
MNTLTTKVLEMAKTSYVEQGRGTPVVLIHGAVSDHRIWEAQRGLIASFYRYIALDLHYHGKGTWEDGGKNYSLLDHVEQVIQFLDALDAGPVHLVGQSYGAHVAVRVALQAREKLGSLVLQEPAVESLVEGPEAPAIMEERLRLFGPVMAAAQKGQLDVAARLMVEALMNQGTLDWEAADEELKAMMMDNARTLPLLFSGPRAAPVTCEQLTTLTLPVLVINGAQTIRFFSHVGERMAKCIPGAQRVVIDDASHGVETQNAGAYWAALKAFLERADS